MKDTPEGLSHYRFAPRLTLRHVMHELFERFFSLERGWLRTARELFIAPGAMIRRYVDGHRREYANPFAYVLAATALSFAVQRLVGFQEMMISEVQTGADVTPSQMAFFDSFIRLLMGHLLFVSLGILIPFALLLRMLFRRSGFNLAEVLVFSFYAMGHLTLVGVALMPVYVFLDLGSTGVPAVGLTIAIAYTSWAAMSFFRGRPFGVILKTTISYLVAYGTFLVLVVVLSLGYLTMFRSAFATGEPWDLFNATERNAVGVVERLLEEGADVDMTRPLTPLHIAAELGRAEIVDLLVAHGADVNARDHLERVPMFIALRKGHLDIARSLAEAGTDATARTHDGESLVMAAVRAENADTVRWALANGADVNAVRADESKATALILAADDGNLEMVELLLSHGADPAITNDHGKTALDLARSRAVKNRLRTATSSRRE